MNFAKNVSRMSEMFNFMMYVDEYERLMCKREMTDEDFLRLDDMESKMYVLCDELVNVLYDNGYNIGSC